MWIQILQVSAIKKIMVQSYGELKFWSMVMKFQISWKIMKFREIEKLRK